MTGTILHLADVHLEACFSSGGLPPIVGMRRRDGLREALERALALARIQRVDAVTVAGDLYDSRYALPEMGAQLAQAFGALAPIPVVVAPGCSDPYDDGASSTLSVYALTRWPDNVTVLRPGPLVPVEVAPGLTIWGAAWCAEGSPELPRLDAGGGRHLLLLHAGPDAALGEGDALPCGVTAEALRASGFCYALLGGRHVGGLWPQGDPRGCFAGSLEPLGPDEASGRHGAALVCIAANGACSVEWVDVGRWRYVSLAVDLAACDSEDEAARRIATALKHDRVRTDPRAVATITITGLPEEGLDLTEVRARVDARAHVVLRVERPFAYDLEQLAHERTVRGLLVRRFRENLDAERPVDHDLRRDALNLALRALDGKGVRPSEVA